MRLNENTIVCGDKVILVPYREEHVATYHQWMKSPELLQLTASEPLTLDEEMDMQRDAGNLTLKLFFIEKWQQDDDKLTFILLARPDDLPCNTHLLLSPTEIHHCKMVGDVNLFMPNGRAADVECEIMIADPEYRRRGLALEALSLFLSYAIHQLDITPGNLIARIGSQNAASIALFEKLGFKKVRLVTVWDEVEMRWGWNGQIEQAQKVSSNNRWPKEDLIGRIGIFESRLTELPSLKQCI